MKTRYSRTLRISAAVFLLSLSTLLISIYIIPINKNIFSYAKISPMLILDRNGILLREVTSTSEGNSRIVSYSNISPWIIKALIATEDKRFYKHKGIDPLAIVRSAWLNTSRFHIVSGASTISQQVIKNILHGKRSYGNKIVEAFLALRMERILSKQQILEQYLNRISFGNNQYGIFAACRFYFGKHPSALSPAEAAFLASLPRLPTYYNPLKRYAETHARALSILDRMHELGSLSSTVWSNSRTEKVVIHKGDRLFLAPHFCDVILEKLSDMGLSGKVKVVRTTLDYSLYLKCMEIITGRINSLRLFNVNNCAVIVMDNLTGDILSLVGSRDYFNDDINGQYNGAFGLRQPGSTLKPFTYGLAIDKGWTLADILPDIDIRFPSESGNFIPRNYDRLFHGPVRMRESLACSYNIPVVYLLGKLNPSLLLNSLHSAGMTSLKKEADFYGLGLTLGNGEISLLELTRGFTTFPLLGKPRKERWILSALTASNHEMISEPPAQLERVLSPESSWLIADVLADNDARLAAFGDDSFLELPFAAGAKTGTSKNYRDNWTVGFTSAASVGVWVGNFDNAPMYTISGVAGAGPIWHDIMMDLDRRGYKGWMESPLSIQKERICTLSGMRPGPDCPSVIGEYFIRSTGKVDLCNYHVRDEAGKIVIRYPPEFRHWNRESQPNQDERIASTEGDGFENIPLKIIYPASKTKFMIDPDKPITKQSIKVRGIFSDNTKEVRWFVDGEPVLSADGRDSFYWQLVKGKHMITLQGKDGTGARSEKSVTIEVFQ